MSYSNTYHLKSHIWSKCMEGKLQLYKPNHLNLELSSNVTWVTLIRGRTMNWAKDKPQENVCLLSQSVSIILQIRLLKLKGSIQACLESKVCLKDTWHFYPKKGIWKGRKSHFWDHKHWRFFRVRVFKESKWLQREQRREQHQHHHSILNIVEVG